MDWVGMFVPRNPFKKPAPFESLNEPDEDDLERLAELREQGSRLHLPHPVRGFLVFDAETPARHAAEQLRKEAYRCTIRAAQDGSWTVTAIMQVVPTPGAIQKLREQLEQISASYQGSYRGWDAPVVY
ncbi:MAG: ribonuclease E inhibitor RraB [Chloroflexi bacterium]|nr:MAG: ribonuclease E inhibitor RraB [Chloroflexota bacterium]